MLSAWIFPFLLKYKVLAAPINAALSVTESAIARTFVLCGMVILTPLNPGSIRLRIDFWRLSVVIEKGM